MAKTTGVLHAEAVRPGLCVLRAVPAQVQDEVAAEWVHHGRDDDDEDSTDADQGSCY